MEIPAPTPEQHLKVMKDLAAAGLAAQRQMNQALEQAAADLARVRIADGLAPLPDDRDPLELPP